MNIPKQLQKEGFRFILVKSNDKIPIEKDWQNKNNYKFDDPKLLAHIHNGGNYGIATGHGNIIGVDFDEQQIQDEIKPLLPKTFTVMSGSGLLHLYYIVDTPETIKILDENNNTLADIQGMKKQLIAPSSIHPNGNAYVIVEDNEIAKTTIAEIKAAFGKYIEPKKDKKKVEQHTDTDCDAIKEKIKIKDLLIEKNIPIERNPTECPFHSSKGGKCLSFGDTLWHCFHCDKGGDIFNLYMELNKCEFIRAKKELAKRCGVELKQFSLNGLMIDSYLTNVDLFYQHQPFFYDKSQLFWFWNKELHKWEIVDETDLMSAIDNKLQFMGQTINSSVKSNYLEAFKRIGRERTPKQPPKTWIQFKDKMFDYKENKLFEATPEYFICNPIPHSIGESTDTPTIDKLFEQWVGVEYVQTLFEIISYCCIIDYPIHLCFCMIGSGRNGKSCFQKMLSRFVGSDNICSTELDTLIDSRFESAKLFKKLVCSLGETNFGILSKTSLLKRLTGQDLIGFEYKNKKPFDDYNYAKIIINSNSLPTSEDTSEGFYRRWLIIDFPNTFKEGKDIIETIPEIEYNNLALRVTKFIPQLIGRGEFGMQGTIEERQKRYTMASNPFPIFIEMFCNRNIESYILHADLFSAYKRFLNHFKKRIVSRKEFNEILDLDGLAPRKTTKYVKDKDGITENTINGYIVEGLELNKDWLEKMTIMTKMLTF